MTKMAWEEYRIKFAQHVVELSHVNIETALQAADGCKVNYDEEDNPDPIEDANTDMSYWDEDEGEADGNSKS